MREILVDVMSTVLFSVLTVAVLYLVKQASRLMFAKMREVEERLLSDKKQEEAALFTKARETLEHIVYISVGAMEQLKAKDLRMRVKLGLEKPEKLYGLALEVLENVKNTISPQVKESLHRYIEDLDGYIAAQIEDSLMNIKKDSFWAMPYQKETTKFGEHTVNGKDEKSNETDGGEVNEAYVLSGNDNSK